MNLTLRRFETRGRRRRCALTTHAVAGWVRGAVTALLAGLVAAPVSTAASAPDSKAATPVAPMTSSAPVEPASLLPVGTTAPDFSVTAHDGKKITLSKLKGRQVVLYFYPKDDTPGCTVEAGELRDNWTTLQKAGVAVLGVSTQDNTSHRAFAEKHELPFSLLPDENGALAAKYRVPVVSGKARRITYLIGKDGKVKHVWPQVTPTGHAAEILKHVNAS